MECRCFIPELESYQNETCHLTPNHRLGIEPGPAAPGLESLCCCGIHIHSKMLINVSSEDNQPQNKHLSFHFSSGSVPADKLRSVLSLRCGNPAFLVPVLILIPGLCIFSTNNAYSRPKAWK